MPENNLNIEILTIYGYENWYNKLTQYKDKNRFIIVDKDTHEIIEDAFGYGFKTRESANSCLYYKQHEDDIKLQQEISKKWWDEHKDFREYWEYIVWRSMKEHEKITVSLFKTSLKIQNIDVKSLPCKIKYLMQQ